MRISALLLSALLLFACSPKPGKTPPTMPTVSIPFKNATREAGIDFAHTNGASGKKYLPQTMGSGCAFLDFDADGWMDILLINGMQWTPAPDADTMALYRNEQNGRFREVTEETGLNLPLYGMGATIGDYDNDGFDDIYVTAVGGSRLFRNVRRADSATRGFVDVTASAGLKDSGWPTSATWIDYDRDGRLDLFVCHYVKWSPATNRAFSFDGRTMTYSTPEQYEGESCRLFHNEPSGQFRDVTQEAGIFSGRSKALGVVALDFDDDGWQDLAVANDTEPNFLYHNQANGTFKEVALEMGVAVSDEGRAKAGMGIDAADEMNDGSESLAITNFSGEQLTLYRHGESGSFFDVAAQSGIGTATQLYLGFGVCFLDYDLDGWQDLFVSNGHIQGDVSRRQTGVMYQEPALLLRNQGSGRYVDATPMTGGALLEPMVGRGAAWGDFDNDGDPDLLITTNRGDPDHADSQTDGRARLFRNDGMTGNSWLRVILRGTTDNRNGFGARVRVRTKSRTQTRTLRAGSSYLSQSDSRLLFGLASDEAIHAVEVQWPSGQLQIMEGVSPRQTLIIRQTVALP